MTISIASNLLGYPLLSGLLAEAPRLRRELPGWVAGFLVPALKAFRDDMTAAQLTAAMDRLRQVLLARAEVDPWLGDLARPDFPDAADAARELTLLESSRAGSKESASFPIRSLVEQTRRLLAALDVNSQGTHLPTQPAVSYPLAHAAPTLRGKPPGELPHGLLEPPDAVRQLVAGRKQQFGPGIYSAEAEQRALCEHTLLYYFDQLGYEVLYRPTPKGPDVLAVGYEERFAVLKDLPLSEQRTLEQWLP